MSASPPATPPATEPPPYAAWPLRVASLLVDDFVLLFVPFLAFGVIKALGLTDENGDPSPAGMVIWIPACFIAMGVGLWNRIWRDGRTGQSLGRQLMGTRLVGIATGQPIGPGKALLRGFAHILDNLPCTCLPIGFLWPLWDAKRQTFADKLVGTIVVRDPR